jgi:hypothetical protein
VFDGFSGPSRLRNALFHSHHLQTISSLLYLFIFEKNQDVEIKREDGEEMVRRMCCSNSLAGLVYVMLLSILGLVLFPTFPFKLD